MKVRGILRESAEKARLCCTIKNWKILKICYFFKKPYHISLNNDPNVWGWSFVYCFVFLLILNMIFVSFFLFHLYLFVFLSWFYFHYILCLIIYFVAVYTLRLLSVYCYYCGWFVNLIKFNLFGKEISITKKLKKRKGIRTYVSEWIQKGLLLS